MQCGDLVTFRDRGSYRGEDTTWLCIDPGGSPWSARQLVYKFSLDTSYLVVGFLPGVSKSTRQVQVLTDRGLFWCWEERLEVVQSRPLL